MLVTRMGRGGRVVWVWVVMLCLGGEAGGEGGGGQEGITACGNCPDDREQNGNVCDRVSLGNQLTTHAGRSSCRHNPK